MLLQGAEIALLFLTVMLAKQEEKRSEQQQDVGSATSVGPSGHSDLYENQAGPFGGVPAGQEEVMDHSGAYDSVQMQMFPSATVDNTPLPQQRMSGGEHVLMDISSDGPSVVDYPFNYGNAMPGQSFTAQLEQPTLPSPLEEIQAQQLAGNGIALSSNQFVPNVDPFSPTRPLDSSSHQPRKGRLPRNVSDSQLYTMDLSQIGTSFQANLLPSLESNIPPQLQAPNLVAHLQSIQPRTRAISTPAGNQAKRARLPRNMSDSRLSSLANISKSPTSPPLHLSGMSGSQRQLQPATAASSTTHQSGRLPGSKGRKSTKLPRNMSDSSLIRLDQQPPLLHSLPPSSSGLPPRRRKMSDPQHVINTTALAANLQASSSSAAAAVSMPSRSPALTFTNPTPSNLNNTSTTSVTPQSQSQFLEQLLQSTLAAPTVNSTLPANVVSTVSSTPQSSDPFQPPNSTLGQLLMQQTTASTGTQQIQPTESSTLRNGTQDPALLKQLYQLQQMLQKQQPGVPTELINALQSLSNNSAKHQSQQQQQQQQQQQTQTAVQSRTVPIQSSLQMKPKNQSSVSQALKSLLQAPPNISIHPSPQTSQKNPVSSITSQTPYQGLQAQSPHVPTVTIQHQPQNRQTPSSIDLNPNSGMPTAVIISPQGGIQATGGPVQTTRPDAAASAVPLTEVTNSLPQVVNVGQGSVGQHILLPASVNFNTLAQLGLSPAALQSVSIMGFSLQRINSVSFR